MVLSPFLRGVITGATAVLCLTFAVVVQPSATPSANAAQQPGRRAWVLDVQLRFDSQETATALLEEWKHMAGHVREAEPHLWHYEMAQSDSDPLLYSCIERYRTKEDYTGSHRSSDAFFAFKPKLKALQDAGKVVITGNSYYETGIGVVRTAVAAP